MINSHKLHIIVEQQLCIYQNVDLRTKKPQNLTKLRLSQNGNFEKCQLQKLKRLLGFLIFLCNFFCSCSTIHSDSLPWSSIFELGPCSRFIPARAEFFPIPTGIKRELGPNSKIELQGKLSEGLVEQLQKKLHKNIENPRSLFNFCN